MIYKNGKFINEGLVDETLLTDGITIYEVIRIFENSPVFISDNIKRLKNSIEKSGIEIPDGKAQLKKVISLFLEKSPVYEGNLKYLLHISPDGNSDEYLEQIPHSYPQREQYENGVPVSILRAERKNPEIKYLNPQLRKEADDVIVRNKLYEVILVSNNGFVTEGSRSNIFFIKDNELYTAPDNQVLPGTARTRVIGLAERLGIKVHRTTIRVEELARFDSAFITGTSPLVLPISNIDDISYDHRNSTLTRIMTEYFKMIKE